MLPRLALLAAHLMLASCAAVPGYMPPPLEGSPKPKGALGKPLESGDVSEVGRYEMSPTEKAMDCKRMSGSMQITIRRLRDPGGREDPSSAASAAEKVATPFYGSAGKSSDRAAVYARERAKLDAYNEELAAKGCKTLDIEAELARAPEGQKKY